MLYYLGIPEILLEEHISECDSLCPLNQFKLLLKDVIPAQDEIVCDKSVAKGHGGIF